MVQIEPMLVGAGTIGASGFMFAQDLVTQGASPSLYLQGVLLGSGVALFLFFDTRERKAQDARNAERRAADEAKDELINELRAEVRVLNERIFRLLGGKE